LQVWLQEFAWTEADKPVKLAARSAMVPDDAKLAQQPIFCFETMMNLLYWSCYVYDHKMVWYLYQFLLLEHAYFALTWTSQREPIVNQYFGVYALMLDCSDVSCYILSERCWTHCKAWAANVMMPLSAGADKHLNLQSK